MRNTNPRSETSTTRTKRPAPMEKPTSLPVVTAAQSWSATAPLFCLVANKSPELPIAADPLHGDRFRASGTIDENVHPDFVGRHLLAVQDAHAGDFGHVLLMFGGHFGFRLVFPCLCHPRLFPGCQAVEVQLRFPF